MSLKEVNFRLTNEEIAERFEQFSALMEIRGEDAFRVRSYRNAASSIREWPHSLEKTAKTGGLRELQTIPGVGRAISQKILELVTRGSFDAWDRIMPETPLSVLDLLRVEGIGIRTASLLHTRFRIKTLDDFAQFVDGGGLEMVDGISDKTSERIRRSLAKLQK
jgi:DNA polymerase (family X)